MATLTGETNTAFTKLVYTAVPVDATIFKALEGHRLKNRLHRWNVDEMNVEAFWGYLMENEPVTFSLSKFRKPVSHSFQYDQPPVWPPNHTSLQVGATGKSQKDVDALVEELLGRWDCVELHMKDQYRPHYEPALKSALTQHKLDSQVMRQYAWAKAKLSNTTQLQDRIIPNSHYIKNQISTYPTFFGMSPLSELLQMTLIDRVKGEIEEKEVELGLVYLNSNGRLGTYGVFAFTTTQLHPSNGEEIKSCAGHLFGTDILHVGGTTLIEEVNIIAQITDHIPVQNYGPNAVAKSEVRSLDVPEIKMLADLFIS